MPYLGRKVRAGWHFSQLCSTFTSGSVQWYCACIMASGCHIQCMQWLQNTFTIQSPWFMKCENRRPRSILLPTNRYEQKRRWKMKKKTGRKINEWEKATRHLRVAALFPDVLRGSGGQVSLGKLASVVEWCITVVVRIAELLLAHDSVDLCIFVF